MSSLEATDHGDTDHGEESASAHEDGVDPHFFTDPTRMADAVSHLGSCITDAVPALGSSAEPGVTAPFLQQSATYRDRLLDLDAEIASTLEAVPESDRVLITNHEVFGYFADRYGFEVLGTVIPSTSSQAQADAESLTDLAQLIEQRGVPAIFADTSSPEDLVDALAAETGGVEVVELYSESLDPDGAPTYVEMMRENARRVADALS
ncbi:MAG: metal ABC transporter substrate-binding protein [Microthrixaceae bacterium]